MIWISRQGQSLFWADAFKGALAMAIPCLAFDWMLLTSDGAALLAVVFLLSLGLIVPLAIFAAAALVMFLFRRPGWLAGPFFTLLLNGAFLDFMR
jgi:hypothetical protein